MASPAAVEIDQIGPQLAPVFEPAHAAVQAIPAVARRTCGMITPPVGGGRGMFREWPAAGVFPESPFLPRQPDYREGAYDFPPCGRNCKASSAMRSATSVSS